MRILLYGSLPTHSLSCCCFLGPSPHDPPLKVKVAGGIEASKNTSDRNSSISGDVLHGWDSQGFDMY